MFKLKNGRKLRILSLHYLYRPLSCGQNRCYAFICILQPIWGTMYLNWHFQSGKNRIIFVWILQKLKSKFYLYNVRRVPYDWKNPIGYLVTTIYQYISLRRMLGLLELFVMFGIGSLLFVITVVRDMKMILKSANERAIAGKQNQSQALKKLHEFIKIHAMLKELSVIHSQSFYNIQLIIFFFGILNLPLPTFLAKLFLFRIHWNHILLLSWYQALWPFAVQC